MPVPARLVAPVLALALVLVASATACAGGTGGTGGSPSVVASPTGATQSTQEACAIVGSSVQDAAAELRALDAGDPQAAVAAMSHVADRLGEAAAAVDNADVAALLPPLQSGFAAAAETLQAIAGGDLSQLPALQQTSADIQASLQSFSDLCAAP